MQQFTNVLKRSRLMVAALVTLLATNTHAQVKIGGETGNPDPSAVLELSNKANAIYGVGGGIRGLLLPKVNFSDPAFIDKSTFGLNGATPITGILVYNTSDAVAKGFEGSGMYYWNGNAWQKTTSNLSASPASTLSASGPNWLTTGNAGVIPATEFIGTTDNISFRVRTNNIQRMIVDSLGSVNVGGAVGVLPANPYRFGVFNDNTPSGVSGSYFNARISQNINGTGGTTAAFNGIASGNYVATGAGAVTAARGFIAVMEVGSAATDGTNPAPVNFNGTLSTYRGYTANLTNRSTGFPLILNSAAYEANINPTGANGLWNDVNGVIVNVNNATAGDKVRNAAGVNINNVFASGADAGQIHTAYGLRISNVVASGGDLNSAYSIYSSATAPSYVEGNIGIGTDRPNSRLHLYGNNTAGFIFGTNNFFVGAFSRPTRLNLSGADISYGFLSHTQSDGTGTYNAVAGRVLRNADTNMVNLTGAIAHVNNPANFQTGLLGVVNSRADQANDGVRYSAAWLRTPNPSSLSTAQIATTYVVFAPDSIKSYFEGNIGLGTNSPNSRLHIFGNNTAGFPFGTSTFFVGGYSRPTRINAATTDISYGFLSHTQSDATGTYNAVAGRVLRNSDTSMANLTGAIAHVNNPANFQTGLLGIVNSRADQANDGVRYSAAWLRTPNPAALSSAQIATTYVVFAPDSIKSYFEGNIGIGTSNPNSRLHIFGNNTTGFPFGTSTFYVGGYSRPTRLNALSTDISYGYLAHSNANATGTYNAVAGRILRTGDTSMANLTAALAQVNRAGTNNFQTALLGTVNSRIDQADDAQVFSSVRLMDAAGTLTAAQEANTYSLFSSSVRKSFFAGSVGIATSTPTATLDVNGSARIASTPLGLSDSVLVVTGAGIVNYRSANAIAASAAASSWSITGNAGINFATNFIGTTDNQSFRIRTNNVQRMVVDSTGAVNIGGAVGLLPANPYRFGVFNDNTPANVTGSYFNSRISQNINGSGGTTVAFNGVASGNYLGTGSGTVLAGRGFIAVMEVGSAATDGTNPAPVNFSGTLSTYRGYTANMTNRSTGSPTITNTAAFEANINPTGTTGVWSDASGVLVNVNNATAGDIVRNAAGITINNVFAAGADAQAHIAVGLRITNVAATGGTTNNAYAIFSSTTAPSYVEGNVGIGTTTPNSRLHIFGNNTAGFAFGTSTFFVSGYARPTRLNTASTDISYGFLSHTNADATGTYNAVAGRVLRTSDTSMANLTAALAQVNRAGTNNFQTALLGTINSRIDQANDAQVFSSLRLMDAAGILTPAQEANTYSVFSNSIRKSFFAGAVGIGVASPNTNLDVSNGSVSFGMNNFGAVLINPNDTYVSLGGNADLPTATNGRILLLRNTGNVPITISRANNTELRDNGSQSTVNFITVPVGGAAFLVGYVGGPTTGWYTLFRQ